MDIKEYYARPRAQRDTIQARLNEQIAEIRANKNFSETGRRSEMAKAVIRANNEVSGIIAELRDDRKQRRSTLERELFGLPAGATASDIMLMRDARDRTVAINDAEMAVAQIRIAAQAGDRVMAKAIIQHAVTKGWTEAVDAYIDTAPSEYERYNLRSSLEELVAIPDGPNIEASDQIALAIRPPKELTGVRGTDLELMAKGSQDQ